MRLLSVKTSRGGPAVKRMSLQDLQDTKTKNLGEKVTSEYEST